MRKLYTFLMVLMIVSCFFTCTFDSEQVEEPVSEQVSNQELEEGSNASKTVINNIKNREEKIAEYTEKYGGDAVYGKTAYYLGLAQKYSVPICFIGLAIGALNFFIIGNKKLEKREQGFGMIVAFLLGLVVFQVLPLLFAIVVAGRWYYNESSFCNW